MYVYYIIYNNPTKSKYVSKRTVKELL